MQQTESHLARPATVRFTPETWQRIARVLRGGELKSAFVRVAVLTELKKREANERRRGAVL